MERPERSRHRQHDEDHAQHGARLRPRGFGRPNRGRLRYRFGILQRVIRFSHACLIFSRPLYVVSRVTVSASRQQINKTNCSQDRLHRVPANQAG
jgi:hypothetical protein